MPDDPLYHHTLYRYAIYHGCIISLHDITVKGLKIKKLSRRGEQRQTTRENRSTIVEQSVIHPDADAGTQYRDDEGADAAGGMDADEAEQELAHKAAQNTQHDVAAGGSLGAHKAVGDVTGQSAYQHAHEQGSQQADQREQAHQHAHQSADQGKDDQDRQSDHTEASLVSFVGTAFSAAYRQMSFRH